VATIALHGEAVAEVGSDVVEELVQAIGFGAGQTLLRKGLQAKRLIGAKEAKQGAFVLPEAAKDTDEHRQHGWVQGIEPRRQVHQGFSVRRTEPAQFDGFRHRATRRHRVASRKLVHANVQCGANQVGDLLHRVTEHDLIETPSHFLPFVLRGLVQVLGVSIEALMEEANQEQRFTSAAGSRFSETL